MSKNERLFDLLGDVSPTYVAQATEKKTRQRAVFTISRKKLFSLIAAVVVLSALTCAMLLPGSAVEPNEGDVEYYEFGTVLTEIPHIILAEDYEALIAMMDAKVAKNPEMAPQITRFKAFYSLQSPGLQKSPKAKEMLLTIYPITALSDIYTLDRNTTMLEDEFLLYLLMYYGEMSQEDLVDAYTKMYDLVDASDLSEEEKESIRATLPEIPVIDENDPATYWVIGEKVEGSELRFTSSHLPEFLTEEGYAQLCELVNGSTQESEYSTGENLFMLADLYSPFTYYSEEEKAQAAAVKEHMQPVTDAMGAAGQKIYILDPYATLHEKTMLTYYLSQETEIVEEQLTALTQDFYNTLRELPLSEKEIDKLIERCRTLRGTVNP